jgi:RNase P/RNase MRP subunit p29
MTWAGAPGDVRADTIVLRSGEVVEGSIIDATRNTVVVQRAIGGMRQMPIRDIEEVRIDLARGQRISGDLLSWADGVYQVRSGGEVLRISEGDILSRAADAEAIAQAARTPPSRPAGPQTVRMAAAPTSAAPEETDAGQAASAREQIAAHRPEGEARSVSAGAEHSPARAAGAAQSMAAAENESPAAGGDQSATAEKQSPPAGEQQRLAAVREKQTPAAGEKQSLAVKASVDPAEPGADQMVFRIELSRPAEQTVVLIYGTVEGTAKAGEDFEPQQGVVTLAPGTKSAEVHVPLVEQPSSTGEKRFELFLTADPKVAEVVDRRITATINGAD